MPEAADARPGLLRKLRVHPLGPLGIGLLIALIVAGICASWLAPHDPARQQLLAFLRPPGADHWLGTDHLGRDLLSRILFGLGMSVVIAGAGTLAAMAIGATLGLVAGGRGGVLDAFLMRAVDLQLSVPFLLIAIMWMAFIGHGLADLIWVTALYGWVPFARVTRDVGASLRSRDFVSAAKALGATPARVLFRHIAPQLLPEIIILTTFGLGRAIILESSLGFLGLSLPPPTPTLGGMISEGRAYLTTAWWLTTFPGLAIVVFVLAASMAGDALRDVLDPKT